MLKLSEDGKESFSAMLEHHTSRRFYPEFMLALAR